MKEPIGNCEADNSYFHIVRNSVQCYNNRVCEQIDQNGRGNAVNRMIRKIYAVLFVLILLTSGAFAMEESFSFTDDLGRNVTIEKTPERVAVLIGSFADIWCLSGGAESMVAAADDTFRKFDLPVSEEVINLGATKDLSLEKLLLSDPDLIIASCSTAHHVELEPVFAQMGLNAVYFDVDTFEDYLRMLQVCTQLTGSPDRYEAYGEALRTQVDAAKETADGRKPTVLYIRATGSSCRVKNSAGSVLGEMLKALDCVNIADSNTSLLEELSLEAILMADPDFIFVVEQSADPQAAKDVLEKTLFSNPAWKTLTAVREGRYHVMDSSLYNLKPNARWGEAYEKLAEILYGEK